MAMYREVSRCRICGGRRLRPILDLGMQALTGVFPAPSTKPVPAAPLELVLCDEVAGCGLVQLRHTHAPEQMYGAGYGYRSGLNASMVEHLVHRGQVARWRVDLGPGDIVLDIGSNDGTLLNSLVDTGARLVGIDPAADVLASHHHRAIERIPEFFSRDAVRRHLGGRRATLITAIAMFYDLEDPTGFLRDVHDLLDDDGVCVLEQSYLPLMIERDAYDTVCHEHLTYFALRQICWMAERAGLVVLDVEINDVNGGSFATTLARRGSRRTADDRRVESLLEWEERMGHGGHLVYAAFRHRVERHRDQLRGRLRDLAAAGMRVYGYGASTKGNVLLQYCGLTPRDLPAIAEVNPSKFGCVTPGTGIPILPEHQVHAMRPDVLLVLPWHFRQAIVAREQLHLQRGGRLLFPLPRIETFGREGLRRAA
jgi:NDP-4-keto-2,6-dideoxyhexose 3-C-methyltransferase